MTGHKVTLPKGARIKDGKLILPSGAKSVSEKIRQRKSRRVKVVRAKP